MTAIKMFNATMPTNPAAIHSIVSMKRSIHARFMSAPNGRQSWRKSRRRRRPPSLERVTCLLRQRVILGQRSPEFCHRGVRIDAGLLNPIAPALDQRFGRLLPQRGLLRCQLVDLMAFLGLDLVDAGILELAPGFADAAGGLGVAIVVDRLFLTVRHLVVLVLVHHEGER